MEPIDIIKKYYEENTFLYNTLVEHSKAVGKLAAKIVKEHPELGANRRFVIDAAMLHDIGIIKTDSPTLECKGGNPYICHGYLGYEMLIEAGVAEKYALVAERHTGAGFTKEEIIAQNLPLPQRDMMPITIEEQIICYADKFFSKSKPEKLHEIKSFEKALDSIKTQEAKERFLAFHEKFMIEETKSKLRKKSEE